MEPVIVADLANEHDWKLYEMALEIAEGQGLYEVANALREFPEDFFEGFDSGNFRNELYHMVQMEGRRVHVSTLLSLEENRSKADFIALGLLVKFCLDNGESIDWLVRYSTKTTPVGVTVFNTNLFAPSAKGSTMTTLLRVVR